MVAAPFDLGALTVNYEQHHCSTPNYQPLRPVLWLYALTLCIRSHTPVAHVSIFTFTIDQQSTCRVHSKHPSVDPDGDLVILWTDHSYPHPQLFAVSWMDCS